MEDLLPPPRLAVLTERLAQTGYRVRLERDHIAIVEPLGGSTDMMHASVKLKPPIEEESAWRAVIGLLLAMNVTVPSLTVEIKAELVT